jgi:hypothetical protein
MKFELGSLVLIDPGSKDAFPRRYDRFIRCVGTIVEDDGLSSPDPSWWVLCEDEIVMIYEDEMIVLNRDDARR